MSGPINTKGLYRNKQLCPNYVERGPRPSLLSPPSFLSDAPPEYPLEEGPDAEVSGEGGEAEGEKD